MLDKQKLFDFVRTKLEEQNRKSVQYGKCAYRHSETLDKCAIGHIILSEEYNVKFENMDPIDVLASIPLSLSKFMIDEKVEVLTLEERVWLIKLQRAHDMPGNDYFFENFISNAKKLLEHTVNF